MKIFYRNCIKHLFLLMSSCPLCRDLLGTFRSWWGVRRRSDVSRSTSLHMWTTTAADVHSPRTLWSKCLSSALEFVLHSNAVGKTGARRRNKRKQCKKPRDNDLLWREVTSDHRQSSAVTCRPAWRLVWWEHIQRWCVYSKIHMGIMTLCVVKHQTGFSEMLRRYFIDYTERLDPEPAERRTRVTGTQDTGKLFLWRCM